MRRITDSTTRRRRPQRCCESLTPRPAISRRYSTRSWSRRIGSAARTWVPWWSTKGRHFRAVATHDYPPEYEALIRQPFGAEASAYQRLVDGERYIHIPDVVAVPTP